MWFLRDFANMHALPLAQNLSDATVHHDASREKNICRHRHRHRDGRGREKQHVPAIRQLPIAEYDKRVGGRYTYVVPESCYDKVSWPHVPYFYVYIATLKALLHPPTLPPIIIMRTSDLRIVDGLSSAASGESCSWQRRSESVAVVWRTQRISSGFHLRTCSVHQLLMLLLLLLLLKPYKAHSIQQHIWVNAVHMQLTIITPTEKSIIESVDCQLSSTSTVNAINIIAICPDLRGVYSVLCTDPRC